MIDLTAYFAALGLDPDATLEEVEQSYRDLITTLHPDKHEGELKKLCQEKLKTINNARDQIWSHFQQWHSYRQNYNTSQEEARRQTNSERQRREDAYRYKNEQYKREQEMFAELHQQHATAKEDHHRNLQQRRKVASKIALVSVFIAIILTVATAFFTAFTDWHIDTLTRQANDLATSTNKYKNLSEQYRQCIDVADTKLANFYDRSPTSDDFISFKPPLLCDSYIKIPPEISIPSDPSLTEQKLQQQLIYNQSRITTLTNDIETYQQQLIGLQDKLNNVNADIATETARVQQNENKMLEIEQQLGTNFMYNAADRRWHPSEFPQWQALQQLTELAKTRISVLHDQKDSWEIDSQNLKVKLDKAQNELQQLKGLPEQTFHLTALLNRQSLIPMQEILPRSIYEQLVLENK